MPIFLEVYVWKEYEKAVTLGDIPLEAHMPGSLVAYVLEMPGPTLRVYRCRCPQIFECRCPFIGES